MSLVPLGYYKTEIEIKKSKFIGIGVPISSPEEARDLLKEIRAQYSDSRHVCYCFVWGKSSTHMGMSDDGEPSGTAGRPMLEVVKGTGYENILVAAVRYFGGIKLGTGGLVKAYTQITKLVVENIKVEEFIKKIEAEFITPYGLYDVIKKVIEEFSCEILNETFLVDIRIIVNIPEINIDEFKIKIMDVSNGKIKLIRH
ncbi:MAG: YigZ family protein [Spirochaetaceae bacterium]